MNTTLQGQRPGAKRNDGYTLLETVIAVAILMAVVIPMLSWFYRGSTLHDAQMELTGIWLIEQEAAVATAFPQSVLPQKRRSIASEEWVLQTTVAGKQLPCYTITAVFRGVKRATVTFYGRGTGAN